VDTSRGVVVQRLLAIAAVVTAALSVVSSRPSHSSAEQSVGGSTVWQLVTYVVCVP
jgi:hypothetical protein